MTRERRKKLSRAPQLALSVLVVVANVLSFAGCDQHTTADHTAAEEHDITDERRTDERDEPTEAPVEMSRETLEGVKAATVYIETSGRWLRDGRESEFSGSGFVVARDGLVLTNAHVVPSADEFDYRRRRPPDELSSVMDCDIFVLDSITIRTHSGSHRTRVYPAQVVCLYPEIDLALLRFQPQESLSRLNVLSADKLKAVHQQAPVWVFGFPGGRLIDTSVPGAKRVTPNPNGPDVSVFQSRVSSIGHGIDGDIQTIRIQHEPAGGNSGGPLVVQK